MHGDTIRILEIHKVVVHRVRTNPGHPASVCVEACGLRKGMKTHSACRCPARTHPHRFCDKQSANSCELRRMSRRINVPGCDLDVIDVEHPLIWGECRAAKTGFDRHQSLHLTFALDSNEAMPLRAIDSGPVPVGMFGLPTTRCHRPRQFLSRWRPNRLNRRKAF